MTLNRVGRVAVGVGLAVLALTACSSNPSEPEETATVTTPSTDTSVEPPASTVDVTDDPGGTDTPVEETTAPSDQEPAETASEPFSAATIDGSAVITVDPPEGWQIHGVDEAITDFDLVTIQRGGSGADDPLQAVVVTDQQLGVDAQGVFNSMFTAYQADTDNYSGQVMLDPTMIDGVEFVGFEVVANTQAGTSRIQYWFGDVGNTVLGIFVHHGDGSVTIPDDVLAVRDSLRFSTEP